MKLPLYFFFGARPVKWVPTADGGMDVLAYDWDSGAFERNLDYLSRGYLGEPDMEEVEQKEFDQRVTALRRERGHKAPDSETS